MEPIRWERVTSVPPSKARIWYFDLREDDHMGHHHKPLYRGKGAPRKILSRSADTVVVEDDYGGGPPTKATVRLKGSDAIAYVFESPMYRSESEMTFTPEGSGTRLRTVAMPGWKGFGKVVGFFMRRSFPRLVMKDLDAHVLQMEEDWKTNPW
jgi:hypothetical protein